MDNRQEGVFPVGLKKAVGTEVFVFLFLFLGFFVLVGREMGLANMFSTMMETAYALLMDTVFYIMAIAVLAGAISGLFSEFGVIALLNKLLSRVVAFVYGLPGACAVGIFTTYLSDNPAILTLANDSDFRRYFKKYQLPALTNVGTAFGMGLIITTFMAGLKSPTGESFVLAVFLGNMGAVVGSIVSTRLMLRYTAKVYGTDAPCDPLGEDETIDIDRFRKVRHGGVGLRFMDALLAGGKSGVEMGMSIIPGVLIICTLVLMLTNGAPAGGYTGAAYEGVGFLPMVGEKLNFLIMPLFGFSSPEAISVPIGLVEKLVSAGLSNAHDIAVFTAMCMCWSGYLSTHVAMMDSLKCSYLTGVAILCHTAGGIFAGVVANWGYRLIMLLL